MSNFFLKCKLLLVVLWRIFLKHKSFVKRYVYLVGVVLCVFLYGRALLLYSESLFWDVSVLYVCSVIIILWYIRKR